MGDVFGDRLKELWKRIGLSLDELASSAGMSKSGIWELEQGKYDPRLSTIRSLAKALGVSTYHLLSEEDLEPFLTTQELRVLQAMRAQIDEA